MSFRPWTPTPSTSTALSPTLPVRHPENEEDDRRAEPSSTNTQPMASPHWGLPTIQLPKAITPTETVQSEDPLPSDAALHTLDTPVVHNNSANPSDESPYPASSNQTTESELPPPPTMNIGFSRGTYTMPNVWYRNYRPISTHENVDLQDKINHIASCIDELIPGHGRLMGEFVLFQFLINRPEGDED